MDSHRGWSRSYELKAVSLLAIGFGLVGLDRFIIAPLFPLIAEDLGLDYGDLGLIAGVLALTWGVASIAAGSLSDRVGYKRVLVVTTVLFSALVAMSGLATGLLSLLLIRGLMGFAEGGFVPASIVATVQASKPSRVGATVGIQQMAAPLVGLGLGPLIAVGLLQVLPGWEWVFAAVALPGFLVAYLMARVIVAPPAAKAAEARPQVAPAVASGTLWSSLSAALKHRNVLFAGLGMAGFLSSLHTLSAFMPNYLTDHMGLSIERMGFVLSGLGVGGVIGMVVVPALSDRVGRKPAMIAAMALAVGALTLIVFTQVGALLLAGCLFVVSAAISGAVAITVGPFVNASVPASIAASATGIVAGIGEMAGGAFAPALAGLVADAWGIQFIPVVSLAAAVFGLLVLVFGMKEPETRSR